MKRLLVGFDSAWTATNSGALTAVLENGERPIKFVLPPLAADFSTALAKINSLIVTHTPVQTIIYLDQPHIVKNRDGMRPVERIVSSVVGSRLGGMQAAATELPESKKPMFGIEAPIWPFLEEFGGPADPWSRSNDTKKVLVFETYPVLYLIAKNWVIDDNRPKGRLPKYNPARPGTFAITDWRFLCNRAAELADDIGIPELAEWLRNRVDAAKPNKSLQDQLDACLCLLASMEWQTSESSLVVGQMESGYIATSWSQSLVADLSERCLVLQKSKQGGIDWDPKKWIHKIDH